MKLAEKYFFDKEVDKYIEEIFRFLDKSIECFKKLDFCNEPKVADEDLVNAELKEVLNLSTKGILKATSMLNILKGSSNK